MKCYYYLVASILTAILTFACSPEEKIITDEEGQVITITAYREDETIQSKTSRDGNGVVSWSAHEEISLFYASGINGGSKFTSTNDASATVADFSGTINVMTGVVEGDAERYFWGIYPYNVENSVASDGVITTVIPDIQTAAEGTFADNHFVSIGKSRGLEMGFYNLCGGFKFRLSHEGVTRVTLKGNNNEVLAGKVKVVMENGRPAVSEFLDAKTELVMTCPNREAFKTGVDYFFVMRPITFENGFTFTMETADSYVGTRRVDVSIEVLRSLFSYSSTAIDSGVEYKYLPEGAVDLGLSVLWATCNLGASTPDGYGDYYAWGETEPYYSSLDPLTWKEGKTAGYDWASYQWCNGSKSSLTKYNKNSDYGIVDNKTVLDLEDDAAHVALGGSWRMPTDAEWAELTQNSTWTWTTQNGVNGLLVTVANGASIFLPSSGRLGSQLYSVGSMGRYWSSCSIFSNNYTGDIYSRSACARLWDFNSYGWSEPLADLRRGGYPIRPVYGDIVHVTGVALSNFQLILIEGSAHKLTATVTPANASESGLTWNSSDGSVVTVGIDGTVSAIGCGTAQITVTTVDGGFTATCTVEVVASVVVPEAVDLGLSVKWASFNLGAAMPEVSGHYYAWGETEPYYSSLDPLTWKDGKTAGYGWTSYRWCNGTANTLTKYNTNSDYGNVDNKTVLELEDDAAHAALGGSWRMPTDAEWAELTQNSTWTWTTQNGVNGYLVSATNGNCIFLPAAGELFNGKIRLAGTNGYYWSSSLTISSPLGSEHLHIYENGRARGSRNRTNGISIRPVTE